LESQVPQGSEKTLRRLGIKTMSRTGRIALVILAILIAASVITSIHVYNQKSPPISLASFMCRSFSNDQTFTIGVEVNPLLLICIQSSQFILDLTINQRRVVMLLSESERLLREIRDELRKSTSILDKMLKGLEAYAEFRKKQSK